MNASATHRHPLPPSSGRSWCAGALLAGWALGCQGLLGIEDATLRGRDACAPSTDCSQGSELCSCGGRGSANDPSDSSGSGGTLPKLGGSGSGSGGGVGGQGGTLVAVAGSSADAGAGGESHEVSRFTAYPLPEGGSFMTLGSDGHFWIMSGGSAVMRVSVDGDATTFPLSQGPTWGVTAGPDDNVWFARPNDKVGRIATKPPHDIKEFPVPAGLSPTTIIPGTNNDLWFAGGKIGRVTTAGVVSVLDGPGAYAEGLALGGDGNLWLTDRSGNAIRSMSVAGQQLSSWSVPTADADPTAIVAGPDGNLWFLEQEAGQIGRVSLTGSISEYVLRQGSRPSSIAVGPDDALWVTLIGGQIARVTTAGSVTLYDVPIQDGVPTAMVAGPDGNMWFLADQLVRFEL